MNSLSVKVLSQQPFQETYLLCPYNYPLNVRSQQSLRQNLEQLKITETLVKIYPDSPHCLMATLYISVCTKSPHRLGDTTCRTTPSPGLTGELTTSPIQHRLYLPHGSFATNGAVGELGGPSPILFTANTLYSYSESSSSS